MLTDPEVMACRRVSPRPGERGHPSIVDDVCTESSDQTPHLILANSGCIGPLSEPDTPILRRGACIPGRQDNVKVGMGEPVAKKQSRRRARPPTSKAALNMLTIQWAKAHPRWRVNSADPGFTATDLNQHRGVQTVEEGTDEIVRLATAGSDGPSGTFSDRNSAVPW